MPHLQPAVALATCEQALRRLVVSVLSAKDEAWLSTYFKAEQVQRWKERREDEQRRRERRGVARTSDQPLDYSELYELTTVIDRHWDAGFSAAFRGVKRNEVLVLLSRLEALRNTVAHSRELLPFEQDLLAGIAGDIRNRVTIHLSEQSPVGEHFPRVESVTDSFGLTVADPVDAVAVAEGSVQLTPGDTVRFVCRGTDPHGRELSWYLRTQGERRSDVLLGSEVELEWFVREDDIAERRQVEVCMRADSTHHRIGFHADDAYIVFPYRVLPTAPAS